ncbi:MAG: hypothetical protein ACI9OE_000552, partial [Mariniflexile sp.]
MQQTNLKHLGLLPSVLGQKLKFVLHEKLQTIDRPP